MRILLSSAARALIVLSLVACRGGRPETAPAPGAVTASPVAADAALPSPLPDPVARVNGQPIPVRSVAVFARQLMAEGKIPQGEKERAVREALERMIERELLFQEALFRRVAVDAKLVDMAYNEARVKYKEDSDWSAFLKPQGLDPEMFRTELRIRLTIEALFEQEVAQAAATIGEDAARGFYDKTPALFETGPRLRASQILVALPKQAAAQAKIELRARAEQALARVRRGAAFEQVARETSDDATSKDAGGELPPFGKGQTSPAFEKAAFALEPGQVSDVVETAFGYHVIKLHERLPSERTSFEDAKDAVKAHLAAQQRQALVEALKQRLLAKAQVERFL